MNLQKELDLIIKNIEASGSHPKLLLHVCCAPCSSYCLEYLMPYFDITVFYANSNIDDKAEYEYRRDESRRLTAEMSQEGKVLPWVEGHYDSTHFHELVKGHEKDKEGGERCGICFEMRLEEAAAFASANGFDYYTTSLSISPLKNAERLYEIGSKVGSRYDIMYLPSDFKKKGGYRRSVELSKEHNLYRQNYCGCSYSKNKGE